MDAETREIIEIIKAVRHRNVRVYFQQDGTVTVRFPAHMDFDKEDFERIAQTIAEHKKSPSASGNLQKGNPTGRSAQENYTTPSAERQEGRPEK